jgi:hypothetical protein
MQWACLKVSLITFRAALLKMRLASSSLICPVRYREILVYFNFFLIDIIILVSFCVLVISTSVHFRMDFVNNPPILKSWVRIT